jgi:hypothetical protein
LSSIIVAMQVLSALITIDVHNRDIVDNLALSGCKSPSEFLWQMQLRYEYDAEAEAIFIKQVNARWVSYSLGPCSSCPNFEAGHYHVAVRSLNL